MIDRPPHYANMDAGVKLLWESTAQTQLLTEIVELLTPPQPEIKSEVEPEEPTFEREPDSVEVSEPEAEPTQESVPVKSKRAGLLARLMGHD